MHRRTKDKVVALRRAVELAEGTVENVPKRGYRRIVVPRPNDDTLELEARTMECLYVTVLALTEDVDRGGHGYSFEQVRQHVRYYGPVGTGKGHENATLRDLRLQEA